MPDWRGFARSKGCADLCSLDANVPTMANIPNTGSPAALTKFLPIAVIAVALIVVAYFFLSGGSKSPAPTAAAPNAKTAPAGAAPGAAAGTAGEPVPELTKEQLLREAGSALRENRLVAPAGNNALEYYLRILEKDPNNATAKDALREMFPIVTGPVEQSINNGSLDEATRVINLLAKADPNNYTLTILRGKLDLKKKQVDREQAQQTAAAAAAAATKTQTAAAANNSAAAQAAAPPPAAPANTAPANDSAAAAGSNAAPAGNATRPANTNVATATPPSAAAAAPAGGETHAAEIVKTSPPDYPADAVRRHTEGWVEVEFTVTADGSVANATVVNANPARVFNTAALSAVGRWTFKPRMENGRPVEEKMRRRIEFKF
jgi:protein TonB